VQVAAIGQIKGQLTLGEQAFDLSQPLTTEDLEMPSEDIKALVGDGEARVSVSFGMSDKDYGRGFDVHASVTLTCDQDYDVIGFAYEAATDIASTIMADAKERAREVWEDHIDSSMLKTRTK